MGREPLVAARAPARCCAVRALVAVAMRLEARRDLGAGLRRRAPGPGRRAGPVRLAARAGPAAAARADHRLDRHDRRSAALLFGSVVQAMTDLLDDASGRSRPTSSRGTGVDALLALLVELVALIIDRLRDPVGRVLRGDEASGIIEPQLAGAMSRDAVGRRAARSSRSSARPCCSLVGGALIGWWLRARRRRRRAGRRDWRWPRSPTGRRSWSSSASAVALFGWLPARWRSPARGRCSARCGSSSSSATRCTCPSWLLDALPFSATPVPAGRALLVDAGPRPDDRRGRAVRAGGRSLHAPGHSTGVTSPPHAG